MATVLMIGHRAIMPKIESTEMSKFQITIDQGCFRRSSIPPQLPRAGLCRPMLAKPSHEWLGI